MPYNPPALLRTLGDVQLVNPALAEVLTYGSNHPGKWSDDAPPAGTTLATPGGQPVSGAVILQAAGGAQIVRDQQNFIISGSTYPPRTASLFVPGVLAAKTVIKLNIPSPQLTNLDAYFYTAAPAATTGASCANIVVSGSSAGSYTMILSTAGQSEWHSGFLGQIVFEQTNSAFHGTGGMDLSGFACIQAMDFTPSAALTVETISMNVVTGGVHADSVIVGIAKNAVNGTAVPTAIADVNNFFAPDQDGGPAYVVVPLNNLPTGSSSIVTEFQLAVPVQLAQGTTYSLVVAVLKADGTGLDTAFSGEVGMGAATSPSFTGSASMSAISLQRQNNGLWGQYQNGSYPYFVLGGTGNGVGMTGTVTVAITLTGAPATPGTDLNISMQI